MTEETPGDRLQRERTGVAGDPVPDADYGDRQKGGESPHPDVSHDEAGEGVSPSVRQAARRLSDPGLLTDRQALAYVLRTVEGVPRQQAADQLGVSVSTLDGLLGRAKRKLEQARDTLGHVEDLESDE